MKCRLNVLDIKYRYTINKNELAQKYITIKSLFLSLFNLILVITIK